MWYVLNATYDVLRPAIQFLNGFRTCILAFNIANRNVVNIDEVSYQQFFLNKSST